MTATPTTIETRLAELTQARAARKDEQDLDRTLTMRQVRAYLAETALLDRRIVTIRTAAEALAALPTLDADTQWLAHLTTWRTTLRDELLTVPARVRDKATIEWQQGLTWSIRLIDFGFGIAPLGIVTLAPARVGVLMAAAGYATSDPELRGPRGWRGSIKDVERRIKTLTRQRAEAHAALDAALLTDEERTAQEAETQAYRDVLNSMNIRGGPDGLRAYTPDGDPLDVADMTPVQRTAFERADTTERQSQQATVERQMAWQ